jgi:hypothetical protein
MLISTLTQYRMRCLIVSVISALAFGCTTERGTVENLSVSMMLLNDPQPFVSKEFAERLALLVIDEKYPKDIFLVQSPASVEDKGENWEVTFTNDLPEDRLTRVRPRLVPKGRLTITIRKVNGAILSIG